MIKKIISFLLFCCFIQPGLTIGAEICDQINSSQDILDCALEKHPDLVRANKFLIQADAFEDQAGQIPNPELVTKFTRGNNLGDDLANNQIDLPFTIQVGGKRSARIEKALAEKDQVFSEFLKTKENVYIFVLKTLHRIRQVHMEKGILEEALQTFSKIQRQYKSRPKLGPEQETSLSVFQLAEGDYKLRKTLLETEENTLERSIEVAIGKPFPHDKPVLPPKKSNWPDYFLNGSELKGSDFRLSNAEFKIAQADLELAKSDSWPDIKIGPTIENLSEGSFQWWTYGINFSIPLPIFNINGGGRAVARAGLLKSEKSLELRKMELNQFQNILLTQYQKSVRALMESVSFEEIENKHRSVERNFGRGVIPSSLVIEAHRQMIDYASSQNEQELIALEALLKLKALDGSLFEIKQ